MRKFGIAGLIFFSSLFPVGCSHSERSSNTTPPDKAIIFVPGFYGTTLVDAKTGDKIFLTLPKALWSGIPLAVDVPDLGVEGARSLRPDAVMNDVGVIPWIYSVDVYKQSLRFLSRHFGRSARIEAFAYDWRRDCSENAKLLGEKVRALRASGVRRIVLVTHSMGGLVSFYFLRYGGQPLDSAQSTWEGSHLIDGVVFGAVPFAGTAVAFRNLNRGTSLALAERPLDIESLATFASIYQLMAGQSAYLDRKLQPLETSVYDVNAWVKEKWGIFSRDARVPAALREKRRVVVGDYLRRAETFAQKLHGGATDEKSAMPVLHLVANGFSTLARGVWDHEDPAQPGSWAFEKNELKASTPAEKNLRPAFAADGDRTVTVASAQLPRPIAQRFVVDSLAVHQSHESLYVNEQVQSRLAEFLSTNLQIIDDK